MIIIMGLLGGSVALVRSLLSEHVYKSSATFIPQGAETGAASALASQIGLRMPSSGTGWGPSIYVELLESPGLLEAIAKEPIPVAEMGGKRILPADLLRIEGPTPTERLGYTVQKLQRIIQVGEDKKLNAVTVSAATPWKSVSLLLVKRAVDGVNTFNLQTRKSQAGAERQFAEEQARNAEELLRQSEYALQLFQQQNRTVVGSPPLMLERDRLQREVQLRQQLYTSLLQNQEEARLREVRDTPVITLLEAPELAIFAEPRNSPRKAIIGGLFASMLATFIAFLVESIRRLRSVSTPQAEEFFRTVDAVRPKFRLRKAR